MQLALFVSMIFILTNQMCTAQSRSEYHLLAKLTSAASTKLGP